MKLRVLIVDDEALARGRLGKLLADEPDVEIVGECGNGPDAIAFIRQHRPDLVFLDIQMPEVSGFDVLRALPPEILPAVVFVTAHDQHAVAAFEVHALDYLLKPFTQARLQEAVLRARRHLEARDLAAVNRQILQLLKTSPLEAAYLSRIAVKEGSQTLFVGVEEVEYLESASNYVVVHTASGNHVIRETLLNLEAKLPPQRFLRVSRSVIVNLDRIKAIQASSQREAVVVLRDDHQLVVTRGLREIQQRLQYR